MKKTLQFNILLNITVLISVAVQAQTPSDAIMMNARQACILAEYNFSSFDQYWEGDLLRENHTIETVRRSTIMPMAAVGIFNSLNFYVGVPYIKTYSIEPNGGKFNGVSGFQDLAVSLKYRWMEKETGKGIFTGLATVGYSTPITNYLADYMPYSLGLGAPELSFRAILQYKLNSGWYLRGAGTYLWRGYAEAEREYYYNDGSYYTKWMDVPNAYTLEAVIGKWLFKNSLQLEFGYFGSKSLSGDDIRAYNAPQPTNDIDFDRLGVFAHYYFPKVKGLGIVAYYNSIINGQNAPKSNTVGTGLTYYFNYLKNKNNEK